MLHKSLLHAAPGFDDPIGLLKSCHLRIEQRCALLSRIIEHMAKHGADQQAKQACAQVLHYFNTSGPQHHADEEEDLFPALLRRAAPAQRRKFQALIDGLSSDHAKMTAAWAALRGNLEAIQSGATAELDAQLVDRFQTLYLAHIQYEEAQAFASAATCLSAEDLERIGRNMAARRNVIFPDGDAPGR